MGRYIGCIGDTSVGVDNDPADGRAGQPKVRQLGCIPPEGFFEATEDDCDDTDPHTYPGAGDPPDDGIDQNCDGRDTPSQDGTCGCATTTAPAPPVSLGVLLVCAAFIRRRR